MCLISRCQDSSKFIPIQNNRNNVTKECTDFILTAKNHYRIILCSVHPKRFSFSGANLVRLTEISKDRKGSRHIDAHFTSTILA